MKAKILGVDLGEARIGLALSDELGMLAHPLETVQVRQTPDPAGYLASVAEKNGVKLIILGMPRNMNGTYGPAAEKTNEFAEKLKKKTLCEVKFWDERMTSVQAQKSLHAGGKNVKQSRQIIDQVAAQLILQSYLDSQSMVMEE